MNIIEVEYAWAGELSRRHKKLARLILHHAAASICTAMDIHRWHLANGWVGIGYHFFVRKDGTIYRGRPENTVGAHAYGANYDSIGVCFEGNFETEFMPLAQRIAGAELVKDLLTRYGLTEDAVIRHSDVCATACPGRNFPFDAIVKSEPAAPIENRVLSVQQAAIADGYKFPRVGADGEWGSECESVASKCVVKKRLIYTTRNATALVQRWLGLEADGLCGKQTDAAIRELQRTHGLTVDGAVGKNTWKLLVGR